MRTLTENFAIPQGYKPELLSPAGDYGCFLAAINAGADAVYLAGPRYGARAYAGNFSREELISAIKYAHLLGVKVYLTLNTLVKESESPEIIPYIAPYVEAGLDGVIIQDMGVALMLKEAFPGLPLHASTQMCVTGPEGVNMLAGFGFKRVVLAREVSLAGMADIRACAEAELEVFVHGAMCYCYSGQCLFSSMLGERSANRGRCAGPCRLQYSPSAEDSRGRAAGGPKAPRTRRPQHLLSLADLCAVEHLGKLMALGVSSFKIEGRMKPAPYVSAITGIYRKYIDLILQNPDIPPEISDTDRRLLTGIYHRGDIDAGYLTDPRGHQSVTLDTPAYGKGGEDLTELGLSIYGNSRRTLPLEMEASFSMGEPISLTLKSGPHRTTVQGNPAEAAKNAPLTCKVIEKQLSKLGDSPFELHNLDIYLDEGIFCTVGALNELRRRGLAQLEEEIISAYGK